MPLNFSNYFKKLSIVCLIVLGITSCKKEPVSTEADYFDLFRTEFTGELALETTAYVEQFWRIAGNTGFNNSIDRVVLKLEEFGYTEESKSSQTDRFTYRIEKRPMTRPTWEPVDASLTIIGDSEPLLDFSTNRNMICQYSSSTPSDGITAEIIYIESIEDLQENNVEGKIVFAEMSPYRLYQPALVEGKAAGIITYTNPSYLQPEKNTTSIQFRSIPYVEDHNYWGIALSYGAKQALKMKLSEGEVSLRVNIETKIYNSEELTVIANIKGNTLPNEGLVFSAHVQEPGANDNASGVGAQLEIATLAAKLIKEESLESARTLSFIWGDEIISTRRYVQDSTSNNPEIKWGISLDMVGENTSKTGGSFLIEKMPDPSAVWTRGNDKHSEWGGRPLKLEDMTPHYLNDLIISVFQKQGEFANWDVNTNPFEGGSDHVPFLRGDIPGLLLWHFTDQFYHTDNDRIENVSKETLKNVSIGALVSAFTLVNANVKTAEGIVQLLVDKAEERLTIEYNLSKNAMLAESSIAEELKIMNAWNDWYQKSIISVRDMSNEPSEKLYTAINEAQKSVQQLTDELIDKLNNQTN
jgi:hypothetical protein